MQLIVEKASLATYLQEHETINYSHPLVQTTLKKLYDSEDTQVERIKRTYEFVRDTIPHSCDIHTRRVTCAASEVLYQQTGLCYAKSHLLAALLRAQGIPTGLCYQRLANGSTPEEGYALHGLVAVFLQDENKWIRLDPRGNKPGIQAEFSTTEEWLAFKVDPTLGEIDYPTIYAEPQPVILQALRSHNDCIELCERYLPESL